MGIHEILLDVTRWRAKTGGLWCNWQDFQKQVSRRKFWHYPPPKLPSRNQAFRDSVRAKSDMARIDALFDGGEYQRAVDGAKILAKNRFWQNYSSHLVLSSHDDTDTIILNERYLHSFSMPNTLETLVIDSDLGTGKT